ncbi:N-6 DNA methylase [Clostridium saccharoperbutylacetonicum]|uniref:N-6 DNA methylase n=1 Tax=Clostridium saccharoperbutylacetonicum TaxID=36745 RepID=UPI000983EC7A|nr:N-6 DNA methylase [Clostridium saccharoperbutylacetonicum]AQR96491.1 restriction enzyme BgcI subunit alpha [Clostridium saccharoperbutylacetonicum]NSB32365.1 type I restriction-modification system DNA methylase subunit/signal transduction histidine kinase [Clostridium saccharoperbutylacetonicum]
MNDQDAKFKIEGLEKKIEAIFSIIRNGSSYNRNGFEIHLLRLIFFKRVNDILFKRGEINFWRNVRNKIVHGNTSNAIKLLDIEVNNYIREVFINWKHGKILIESISESFKFFYRQSEYIIYQIFMYLDELDLTEDEVPVQVMGRLFNGLLDKYISKEYGYINTPTYLRELMCKLLNVKKSETVYDPTLGIGSLIIEAIGNENSLDIEDHKLFGQETNSFSYSFCIMNMIMNGLNATDIYNENTIQNPQNVIKDELITFDKIISHIPLIKNQKSNRELFSGDIWNRFMYSPLCKYSITMGYIEHIFSSMGKCGKAVILVTTDSLYRGDKEQRLRQSLVEEDVIEAIIFLPTGVFNNVFWESSILILNKDKHNLRKNKILLINLRDENLVEKIGKDFGKLDIDEILDIYLQYRVTNNYTRIVDYNEIRQNNFELSYARYDTEFLKSQEMMRAGIGKKVQDISEVIQGTVTAKFTAADKENGVPVITAKNLNSNIEDIRINFDQFRCALPQNRDKVITQKCIIVSLYGGDLKPTIFYPGDNGTNEIIIHRTLTAIIPKDNKVDIEYLYYQFYSSIVIKQYNWLRGTNYGGISRKLLSEIIIIIPSKEMQSEQVLVQKNDLMELEKLRYHNKLKAINNQDSVYDAEESIIRVLVHNILPDITAAKMALNRIQRYLERKSLFEEFIEEKNLADDFFDFDEKSTNNEETVKNVFNTVNRYIKTFEQTLVQTKETVQLRLEDRDFELINIKDLLLEIKDLKINDIGNKYKISIECQDVYIFLNKVAFHMMIKNLLRNAEMHGFDFIGASKKYKVEFKVIEKDDHVIITYINNGRQFTLSKEEYIRAGTKRKDSTGYGLGGAYIDRVIKAHSGSFEIIPVKEGMKMKFIIPKKRGRKIN